MAHTDKDRPYAVKTQDEGIVHHDHRQGRCVIGSFADARNYWNFNRKHRAVCPRWNTTVECIHDGERIRLQAAVDHARAAQRSNFRPVYWDTGLKSGGAARGQSSEAIHAMLSAGRIPNCNETKTHKIDVTDIDLRLIPGESVTGRSTTSIYAPYRRNPSILIAWYDRSIRCRDCEAREEVTCWIEIPRSDRRHSYSYCSCWACEGDENPSGVRREQRDNNRKRAREWNTFQETE